MTQTFEEWLQEYDAKSERPQRGCHWNDADMREARRAGRESMKREAIAACKTAAGSCKQCGAYCDCETYVEDIEP